MNETCTVCLEDKDAIGYLIFLISQIRQDPQYKGYKIFARIEVEEPPPAPISLSKPIKKTRAYYR